MWRSWFFFRPKIPFVCNCTQFIFFSLWPSKFTSFLYLYIGRDSVQPRYFVCHINLTNGWMTDLLPQYPTSLTLAVILLLEGGHYTQVVRGDQFKSRVNLRLFVPSRRDSKHWMYTKVEFYIRALIIWKHLTFIVGQILLWNCNKQYYT